MAVDSKSREQNSLEDSKKEGRMALTDEKVAATISSTSLPNCSLYEFGDENIEQESQEDEEVEEQSENRHHMPILERHSYIRTEISYQRPAPSTYNNTAAPKVKNKRRRVMKKETGNETKGPSQSWPRDVPIRCPTCTNIYKHFNSFSRHYKPTHGITFNWRQYDMNSIIVGTINQENKLDSFPLSVIPEEVDTDSLYRKSDIIPFKVQDVPNNNVREDEQIEEFEENAFLSSIPHTLCNSEDRNITTTNDDVSDYDEEFKENIKPRRRSLSTDEEDEEEMEENAKIDHRLLSSDDEEIINMVSMEMNEEGSHILRNEVLHKQNQAVLSETYQCEKKVKRTKHKDRKTRGSKLKKEVRRTVGCPICYKPYCNVSYLRHHCIQTHKISLIEVGFYEELDAPDDDNTQIGRPSPFWSHLPLKVSRDLEKCPLLCPVCEERFDQLDSLHIHFITADGHASTSELQRVDPFLLVANPADEERLLKMFH